MRSSRQRRYLVGVSGQAVSGHGSFSAFDDSLRSLRLASAASAGGTSWQKTSSHPVVLAREVDRDRIVSALAQRGRDEVPVPGASAAAMDERKRRHAQRSPIRNRMTGIDALTL